MLTLEQAKNLEHGTVLYHIGNRNADGSLQKWRVNGKVRTWKTMPEKVEVPLKHGMYAYDYLTEHTLDLLCLTEDEARKGE